MRRAGPRAVAALALALAACTATLPPPAPTGPPASTVPPGSVPPPVSIAPPASAATTASAIPAAAIPAGGIDARPLGSLTGDWAFVTAVVRGTTGPQPVADVAELWAIPLAGGAPKLAIRFASAQPPGSSQNNFIARQLSPDGRRIVLSIATPRPTGGSRFSLIVVDLETGRTTLLGRDDGDSDLDPAWSPDGARIAYRRRPDVPLGFQFDDGAWVMNADGTNVRRLVPGAQGWSTVVFDWTPDSRGVAFSYAFEDATYTVADTATGTRTRISAYVTSRRGHSWRAATPMFAGSFQPAPRQAPPFLMVTDAPGATERILIRETDVNVILDSVRWHPARSELLYVRTIAQVRELYALELDGSPLRIPTTGGPLEAEWSPTGNDVLFLHAGDPQLPYLATELRTVRRDGTGEHELFTSADRAFLMDLAVHRYP